MNPKPGHRLSHIGILALICFALAGCGATVQTVKVPITVPCQAAEPVRPVMPTESLKPGVKLDDFAKSSMAEIERREGYEGKLVAALRSCITPG